MPKNKVQFQKGMSLREFMVRYGSREHCEQALFFWHWPQGFVCPECGHSGHCVVKSRRLFQCNACGRQTSIAVGTVFASSKLPLTVWFLAIDLITQAKNGISSLALARQLGISHNSAWLMKHKLMQAMLEQQLDTLDDESLVAIDAALPLQSLALADLSLRVAERGRRSRAAHRSSPGSV